MADSIRYRETTELSPGAGGERGAQALRYDPTRRLTLRFRLRATERGDIEAVRYARRAMIREERTRGLEWDEPSIEDPAFTATEIRWFALASQAPWCREKVAELVRRANAARETIGALENSGDRDSSL